MRITGLSKKRASLVLAAIAVTAGAAGAAVGVYLAETTTTSPYESAISFTKTRAAFAPKRTIEVSTATQLEHALANLQPGDLVRAAAGFTVAGTTTISERLSSWAVVDLTGYPVKFVYSDGKNYPAVWLKNPSHIRLYGGELSTADTGGACLLGYGGQHITWWGFTAHDCGGNGASFLTVSGPAEHDDFQGTIWKVGQNLAWDPHKEKGSGLHCANLDDHGSYPFQDNRFALYCHDIPVGAAIEYGDSTTYPPVHNTIYLKAVDLTFVARTQTGGNGIQFWGIDGQSADIKYLDIRNAQGYALFTGGMYPGATLSGVTVEDGTATHTNLNSRYAAKSPWDTRRGVVYRNVKPAP